MRPRRPHASRPARASRARGALVERLEGRALLAVIAEFPVPTVSSSSRPGSIALGPDGNLWVTQLGTIGRITPTGTVTDFPLPSVSTSGSDITAGPDGNLWFADFSTASNAIGRITTAGVVTEFPLPASHAIDGGVTAGPDGNVWFVTNDFSQGYSWQVNRITPAGHVDSFPVVDAQFISGITTGPDGNLWFTRRSFGSGDAQVDRITPSGAITGQFVIPRTNPSLPPDPGSITAGADGALWFTETNNKKIGRITTDGQVSQYALAATSSPTQIVSGPDGALEFLDGYGAALGRITTSGTITEAPLFPPQHNAGGIATGPDGALWITDTSGKVARLTPAGAYTEFPLPGVQRAASPYQVAAGPDGNVWFTELTSNPEDRIGYITPAGAVTVLAPPAGFTAFGDLTAGPDGNLWVIGNGGIDRVTPAGVFTAFPVGSGPHFPRQITAGPDGALWFTESAFDPQGNSIPRIGRITTAGGVTEFSIPGQAINPDGFQGPRGIVAGPDGALWFTEDNGFQVGRITTAGNVTVFKVLSGVGDGIAAGPDGALWFTTGDRAIGRITTGGQSTSYPVGAATADIATGQDGGLWFTTRFGANLIGRIGVDGGVEGFAVPSPSLVDLGSIAPGPDGNLWFIEAGNAKIGRVDLGQVTTPPTFTVTTAADSGPGSLRDAIIRADADTFSTVVDIKFDLPGPGVQTIRPASALPAITRRTVVDATTQPGYAGSPLVVLDGSGAGTASGLTIGSGSVTGLAIDHFSGDGIIIQGSDVSIRGNYIGVDATGSVAAGNGGDGVRVEIMFSSGGPNVTIGGTAAGAGNVISGNGKFGIDLRAAGFITSTPVGPLIQGNLIGTDSGITRALPNRSGGISASGTGGTVGGTAAGAGNVLSGNGGDGIATEPVVVPDYYSEGTRSITIGASLLVQGNAIGTDPAGARSLDNGGAGVNLGTVDLSTIGGTAAGAGNVFGDNRGNAFANLRGTVVGNRFPAGTALAIPGITVAGSNAGTEVGDPIHLAFTVTNRGPAAATHVAVQFSRASGVYLYSYSGQTYTPRPYAVVPGPATPDPKRADTYILPALAPGASAVILVVVPADYTTGGQGTLAATLAGLDQVDPDTTQGGLSASAVVSAARVPSLSVVPAVDPSSPVVNHVATITFTIRNSGNGPATGVALMPSGLTGPIVAVRTSQGTPPTPADLAGSAPVVRLGTIAAGGSATLSVDFLATAPGYNYPQMTATADQLIAPAQTAFFYFSVAPTFVVTTAADSGPGSLRQAILDADADPAPGVDTINFSSALAQPVTIAPASPLPPITRPLVIDGTPAPGQSPPVLDGSMAGVADGLTFAPGSGGGGVRGIVIDHFAGSGVVVRADGVTLSGLSIGVDAAGQPAGNGGYGVAILGGSGVSVTGSTIADNGFRGLLDQGTGTQATGNTLRDNGARQADLVVTASTSTAETVEGGTLAFTFTVTNRGPGVATGVTLRLSDGAGRLLIPVSSSTTQGAIAGGSALDGQAPFAELGTLAPGASAAVTVTVLAGQAGGDTLTAVAAGSEDDSDATSNAASIAVVAAPAPLSSPAPPSPPTAAAPTPPAPAAPTPPAADLLVSALAPSGPVRVGVPSTFIFFVTNLGTSPASGVSMAIDLAGFLGGSILSIAASQGTIAAVPGLVGLDLAELGTLAPGASAAVTVVVAATRPGPLFGRAAASGDQPDSAASNNLAIGGVLAVPTVQVLHAGLTTRGDSIDAVRLTFDSGVPRGRAEDLRNYHLATTRPAGHHGGRVVVPIRARSAHYDRAHHRVLIRLAHPLPRVGAPIRVVVDGPGSPGRAGPVATPGLDNSVALTIGRPGGRRNR